jgi:hypothetical protein
MKRNEDWLSQIHQACYNAEVGDFQEMDALIKEIMALDEAAQQRVQADKCPVCFGDQYLLHNDGLMHPCPACGGTGIRR